MAEQVPLTTLLSWAWIAFAIETDNTAEAAGSERVGRLFRISMPMWANGLRFIDDKGVTVEEFTDGTGAGRQSEAARLLLDGGQVGECRALQPVPGFDKRPEVSGEFGCFLRVEHTIHCFPEGRYQRVF